MNQSAIQRRQNVKARYQHLNKGLGLNENQITAMVGLLHSADKITGLQGSAGTGKTTNTLVVVTEYAKSKGFEVIGLAPTGRARKELAQAGIPAQTLQRFLLKSSSPKKNQKVAPRLLIVDESSLVSTKQFRDLLKRLGPQDRVIGVGDIRQHESVEAARIFHEQQLGGMRTETLNKTFANNLRRWFPSWSCFSRAGHRARSGCWASQGKST